MGVRVLVVDDTDHVRTMLVDMLQLDGFEVCGEAASGTEAIGAAAALRPRGHRHGLQDAGHGWTRSLTLHPRAAPGPADHPLHRIPRPELEQEARSAGVAICIGKVEGLSRLERHITELARDLAR